MSEDKLDIEGMKKIKDALDAALQGVKKEDTAIEQPNPKNHLIVSLAKSALRIMAGCFLFASIFKSAAVLFILAELLGILEELV